MRRQDPARRREILQAARRRLEHYGYEKTTMAEIASDAGMAVGTLYQYFK
ncbi:MAG: helix-turn-helix domain-containing protein, partial [Acidobacteriota bacterium]